MIEKHNFLCENGACLSVVEFALEDHLYQNRFFFSRKLQCPVCARDMYEVNQK